jgi:hypothetical protein
MSDGIPDINSPEGLAAIEQAVKEIMYHRMLTDAQKIAMHAVMGVLEGEFGVHLSERHGDPVFMVQLSSQREFCIMRNGLVEEVPEELRLSEDERESGKMSAETRERIQDCVPRPGETPVEYMKRLAQIRGEA